MAFTAQITGSPFTTPTNNIGGLAYVNHGGNPAVKRIYYTTDTDFTKIFCMSVSGSADTSREFTLHNQGGAQTNPGRGLASDGTYLYALVGTLGSQYMHVYKLSDRTFIATYELGFHADHYARGIETYVKPGTTERRIAFLQDNIIRSYTVTVTEGTTNSVTLSQQTDGSFTLPINEMVTSGAWQSLAWDSLVNRLLVVAEQTVGQTERDKVFGFLYSGTRDDREDFLPGVDIDAMSYNSDDADLYMVHETSTNLYAWGDFPRWQLGDTDLNITPGQTKRIDLKTLVDAGATITARNEYTTRTGLQGASLSNGVFTWTNPPDPAGGATQQRVNLTFRATLGSNSTDQVFNFVIRSQTRPVVQPTWSRDAFPRQTVYEPYTPPAGAPSPHLLHGFSINLSDYVHSGTPPYNFTARSDGSDFPGTFQITTRYVDQRPIQDRLVFNASAVAASQLNRYIDITVSNSAGNSTQRLPLEVVNLIYPTWQGSQTFNIDDTSSHSFDLRDHLTGEPQADIDIVGTAPESLNANLNNGTLTIRANALGTDAPYSATITVKATNILTDTDGVQRTFTFNVAQRQLPNSAPVWLPAAINIMTDRGQQNTVDLSQYIQSGRPQPYFSVGGSVLDTIQGFIHQQHFFRYTVPNDITTDTTYSVDVTATNDVDSAVKRITITGIALTSPVLLGFPAQSVHQGDLWQIDLNDYVNGKQPITYAYTSPYVPPQTMALSGSHLSWTPTGYSTDQVIPIQLTASNADGMLAFTLSLQVNVDVQPVWTLDPLTFEIIEGESKAFDLTNYVRGVPDPQLHLAQGQSIPHLNIAFTGKVMTITDAPNVDQDTNYIIPVAATNSVGSVTKNINLKDLSRASHEEISNFSDDDYNTVRYLIASYCKPDDVPNTVIASTIYAQAAIDWVVEQLPAKADRTLVNLNRKKRAVIYRCAGLLCGHFPELVAEGALQSQRRYAWETWPVKQADLFRKARQEVSRVIRDEQGLQLSNLFQVTGGN